MTRKYKVMAVPVNSKDATVELEDDYIVLNSFYAPGSGKPYVSVLVPTDEEIGVKITVDTKFTDGT